MISNQYNEEKRIYILFPIHQSLIIHPLYGSYFSMLINYIILICICSPLSASKKMEIKINRIIKQGRLIGSPLHENRTMQSPQRKCKISVTIVLAVKQETNLHPGFDRNMTRPL